MTHTQDRFLSKGSSEPKPKKKQRFLLCPSLTSRLPRKDEISAVTASISLLRINARRLQRQRERRPGPDIRTGLACAPNMTSTSRLDASKARASRVARQGTGSAVIVAAQLLLKIFNGASLKSLCRGRRSAYALVCETLRRRKTLERALGCCGWELVSGEAVSLEHAERLILAHDLLFGNGLRRHALNASSKRQNEKEAVRRLLRWQAQLLRNARRRRRLRWLHVDAAKVVPLVASTQPILPAAMPRYARVNTLVTSMMAVKHSLEVTGFSRGAPPTRRPQKPPVPGEMWEDPHVPGLLVLPPRFELHQHQLVHNGSIVLQEKPHPC